MFQSIVGALKFHAKETPEKICVVDEHGETTYQMMWDDTKWLLAYLQELNVQKGDAIAVECTQDVQYLKLCMACQLMGGVFVPLEKNMPEKKASQILEEVNAKIFFSKNIKSAKKIEYSIDKIEWGGVCKRTDKSEPEEPDENDVAEILYTTGTTGKSKGIIISNANNVAIAENIIAGTQMKKDAVEIVPLPLSHSHGLRSCYADILNGSTILLLDGVMNVRHIFDLLKKYPVTAFDLSPNAARILLKLSKGKLKEYQDQISFVQIGTAALDEELKSELCDIFPKSRLYNFYGSTESGRACVLDFNKCRGKKGCIGKPAVHAEFMITDEKRTRIQSSISEWGLIAVAGKMNMLGYLHNDALTKEIMHHGYIYTNDMGYIDEDGYIYVMARADDVINYKGIKIAPEEIEEQALKYKGVIDCACVAKEDKMCGQIPKLYVRVECEKEFDITGLMDFLRGELEAVRVPSQIEFIDEIPRTSNGKKLRRSLKERK